MLCNYYVNGLEEQPGDQPVRVFYNIYNNIFLNIRNELSQDSVHVSKIGFHFKTENNRPTSPFSTTLFIQIHDSFLSFLWSYCYALLISMPAGEKELTDEEREKAYEHFRFSLKLLDRYVDWDLLNTPNPELYDSDEKQFIGKTNYMFLIAVNYIFYHEFAHIVLGHCEEVNKCHAKGEAISRSRSLEMEKGADFFAFEKITKGKEFDELSFLGVLVALCALTFTSPNFTGGKEHPDPDHRLVSFLEYLNFPDDHYSWGFGCWALMQWQLHFKTFFGFPDRYVSQKTYFYDLIEKLDAFKNS